MLQFLNFNSASTTADCLGAPRPQNVKKRKKEESEATIAATTTTQEEGDEDDQGEGATADLELEDRKEKRERRHTRLSGTGAYPPVLLYAASPKSRPGSRVEDVLEEAEEEEEEEEDLGCESSSYSTAPTLAAAQVATLEGVPMEVLYLILGHLPPHELCRVALVCQRWHEAVADDFLWQRIHSALIAPCEQQSATASAAAPDGVPAPSPGGRVWRQRCVEVACALQKYFGLELGHEADFTLSLSVLLLSLCSCVS